MTETLSIRVHVTAAPRFAVQLSHVIQRERQRPKNPTDGSAGVATPPLKFCCHSRASRGNPPVGSAGGTTTYRSALHRGSPLREDDGGRREPSASTFSAVILALCCPRLGREPRWNQPGDCVVAKSARLRFRLAAKASPAPLLLLFGRDPLRWVRVRDGGIFARMTEERTTLPHPRVGLHRPDEGIPRPLHGL